MGIESKGVMYCTGWRYSVPWSVEQLLLLWSRQFGNCLILKCSPVSSISIRVLKIVYWKPVDNGLRSLLMKTFCCRWEVVTGSNVPLPPDPAPVQRSQGRDRGARGRRGASRASGRGASGRAGSSSSGSSRSNSSGWRGQSDFGGSNVVSPTGEAVRSGNCFKCGQPGHWSNACPSWGGFFASTLDWTWDLVSDSQGAFGSQIVL